VTNFDRIKAMSVEEMAFALVEISHIEHIPETVRKEYARTRKTYRECFIEWLESEVETE
jgi:hypothetical protein